jgi:hypothetical protein
MAVLDPVRGYLDSRLSDFPARVTFTKLALLAPVVVRTV